MIGYVIRVYIYCRLPRNQVVVFSVLEFRYLGSIRTLHNTPCKANSTLQLLNHGSMAHSSCACGIAFACSVTAFICSTISLEYSPTFLASFLSAVCKMAYIHVNSTCYINPGKGGAGRSLLCVDTKGCKISSV